jgi:hypothetical protein
MPDLFTEQAPAEQPAPAEAPAQAPAAASTVQPAAPTSMLEAVQRSFVRDEQGRFAKGDVDPAASPSAGSGEAAAPAPTAAPKPEAKAEAKPEDPADLTKMPEGLGGKAQQRFQALANGIKERDEQLAAAREQLTYVQQSFQEHGVTQPQFEQAMSVVGMLNKGDYRGALQVLDEQRRQIALALGEALPGVDALGGFPDLREKVNGLQMTEQDAMHVAMLRRNQAQTQQAMRTAQQSQAQEAAERQAVQAGQAAVDKWAKDVAATDMDFPVIEKMLLPKLPQLLAGVPPQQWSAVVRANYELIKDSVTAFRRPAAAPAAPDPLRPAGAGGGKAAPRSMYEAMFGAPASA